ncbi:MAG TPA: F0F1 ATP synthase subunit A [Candidatus Limnocylindria bacterium]|nr:F0F1 ATP synthase subunit A [Candidatus Limnocylindria bacterium]
MRLLRTLLGLCVGAWLGFSAVAAETEAHELAHAVAGHAEAAEHAEGLPSAAPVVFHVGPLPVTNSMILTWIVALLLVVFIRIATSKMELIPSGAQNFWEWLIEGLYEFLEGVMGADLVKKTFWFFATVFLFILSTNWFGLIPGVGSIGYGVQTAHGFHVTDPVLRGANADFNMTFAIAMVFFGFWFVWALQSNGIGGFLLHIFGPKGETSGALKLLMIVVFLAVGCLEVVSILFRPVSLSFRLYGNIFAGENMLEAMTHLGGTYFGWLVALPFYFMELMVGIVQALVFTLLTAVFTLLICSHEEGHEEHGHGEKAH